jgi:hypothetical protein
MAIPNLEVAMEYHDLENGLIDDLVVRLFTGQNKRALIDPFLHVAYGFPEVDSVSFDVLHLYLASRFLDVKQSQVQIPLQQDHALLRLRHLLHLQLAQVQALAALRTHLLLILAVEAV